MPLIQRYPQNSSGRDFVIGDLHGCRSLLDTLLGHVQFDPALDRLFSTGDLIDRGPDSAGCLELLKEDWFHAVMGNHELMLLRYLESVSDDSQSDQALTALEHLLINGGDWILSYERKTGQPLADWLPALNRLPMIASVGTAADQRFHVTHGDLLLSRGEMLSDELIDLIEESEDSEINRYIFDGWPASAVIDRSVWSRRLFKHAEHYEATNSLKWLSPVYAGHTMVAKPRLLASHIFIDGGAFLAGRAEDRAGLHGLNLIDHQHRMRYWTNGERLEVFPLPEANSRPRCCVPKAAQDRDFDLIAAS